MKLRYIALFAAVVAFFSLLANANTDDLKSTFFDAESLLDASAVTLFDGTCKKDTMTEFFVEIENGSASIDYCIYTDTNGKYYLESSDNFPFTVITDKSQDELILPFGIISLFADSAKWHKTYAQCTQGFRNALKNSVTENDFRSDTTYVKEANVRKKCETITLNLKGESLFNEIKKYLSSDSFVDMINTVYGTSYDTATMALYADSIMTEKYSSVIYKKSIVGGKAISENITVTTKDNILSIGIKNNASRDKHTGEITVSDTKGTLDVTLSYKKDKKSETLSVKNKDVLINISKDDDAVLYNSLSNELTQRIRIATAEDYMPQSEFYDMSIPQNKRLMLNRLSGWLTGNPDAALLFRTYEVDLKINFDE